MTQMEIKHNGTACLAGVLVMIVLTVIATMLLPIFIINEYLPIEYTRFLIIILMCITGFAGAMVTAFIAEDRAGGTAFVTNAAYCVLLMFAAIFIADGVTMQLLYRVIACGVGGFAAWLVVRNRKKPHLKRKKRSKNR